MRCTIPPPLSDDDLYAALDGFIDDQVQKHLETCPACAARLYEMRKLEATLMQRLKRFECPLPQQLGDYHMGMLEGEDNYRIEQHLAICPLCQNEINILIQFLDDTQTSSSGTKLAQIIRPPESLWRAEPVMVAGNLALKSLRGSDESRSHDAKVNSANIYIETRVTSQGFLLTGQIIDNEVKWIGAIAEIWQNDVPQQLCILDEMCEFKAELTNGNPVTLHITSTDEITIVVKDIILEN
jgi:hypothetical protein